MTAQASGKSPSTDQPAEGKAREKAGQTQNSPAQNSPAQNSGASARAPAEGRDDVPGRGPGSPRG